MGLPKLLLPWHGRCVIEHVLDTWKSSRVTHVLAVVRPDDDSLAVLCRGNGAEVVIPAVPPPEMRDSVAAALNHIAGHFQPTQSDAWLLAPADMPELSAQVIDQLIDTHEPSCPRILVPTFAGRRGHPVLFPWHLAEEVFQLGPNEGINELLSGDGVLEIPIADLPRPRDFDTPEEFQEISSPRG
jgi:molybdenum cofactor cytidylyltransferase